MLRLFALINIVYCSTFSVVQNILEDVIDSDLYYLKYQIQGNEKILSIGINFTQSYISSATPLKPEIVVIDESINFKDMYTYSVDIQTTYVSINLLPEYINLLPSYFKFQVGPFQYPIVNIQFYESIFINDYQEQIFTTRGTRSLPIFLIYPDSTTTSDSTTLYIEYEPQWKNFEFDVISLEFIQQYKSQIQFSNCEGISGYGKNTICWTVNNFVYIQQDKSTFTQNSQKDKIKIKITDFINPYYLGTTQVKLLLKDKKFLSQNYYSSFGSSQFLIKQQRISPINLQHQIEQINSITLITFEFPVKVFNELLLVDLTFPNFEQKNYLIECDDPNLQIDSVTYVNYNNQKLQIKTQQKLIDYNIKLKIQNYLNSNIPTTQYLQYSIKEVFTSNSDQLKMQIGKGTINFIPNEVIIKNIECTSYYIGQMTDVTLTFQTDVVIQQFSYITLQFNNQLNFINLQIQPNQISEQNDVKLFSIFDGVSKEYTIKIYNIQNPQTPQNLNYLNMLIFYQNYLISSNQNSKYIDIISGILKIQQANIYNIIDNSLTTMILELEFNIIHTYISDLVIVFDTNNINFDQLKQEVQCALDEININCQIFQDQLTIFDFQVKKKQYQLKIQYIPYPRSMQPLIIKSMKQINDSTLLTQTENQFIINTDYYRSFEDFQIQSQQNVQIQKNIALNLAIIPSQTILKNEYLIVNFNGYIEFTQNSGCLINQFDVQINCEFNDQFVKIIILNGQMDYSFNYILTLQNIKLLKDFISLDLTAYTQDAYITQKSSCFSKFAQITQSSLFPQFSFDPKDTYYYQSSIYYLFFENLKTIPQGGYLELQMNDLNIDFLNGDINSVSGNEKLSHTQIFRILNSFSLKFYFKNDIQSGMHLFQLTNVINPQFNKKLDNYKFNLYSFDKQHNLLESQSYDLIINFKCQIDNCLICNQPNYCDKCGINQITYYGKCIDTCPKGTVYSNGVCQRCNTPSSCLECSELDTVLCKLCGDGYTLINGFCKWIIESSVDQPNNQTTSNNTQQQNTSQSTQQFINKDIYIPKKIIDINVFAIIVLSIVNLFLLRSILRKQTNLNNTILAISGITDQSLQFIVFAIILVNYSLTQSIISLVLIFISMIQQVYAYSTIKFHTSSDIDYYQNWNQYKLTRFIRVLYLSFDWKIIFIHKSSLTDSPAFNIKFDNEYRLGRVYKFLFSIKICVNLLNLMMLGVILLQQQQIAQLIYESIAYNIVLILIQMNKIYEINKFIKKISPSIDFDKYRIQCNLDQQEEQKKIVKITPESMIIQNTDQL